MPAFHASPDEVQAAPLRDRGGRRARPIYRVFVSSTWLDLQPERRALMDALHRMEEMRFVGMEFFGNRPDDTHEASLDQVGLCEVFVGLIGHRYGSGITEAEYRRARELGLPCFIYFKRASATGADHTDSVPALAARLNAFKVDLLRNHTVKEFTSADELAANATADLHNWVAAQWITLAREDATRMRPPSAAPAAAQTNIARLLERVEQDWIRGVLEASLHHRAWLELGLDWRDDAVEHPWDRIIVAPDRPIKTLGREDSIADVFEAAQNTLLVLGEPGAGKTTTLLELARDLITRSRSAPHEPAVVVLALSTWRETHKHFADWIVAELGLRYQAPKKLAQAWLEHSRLVLLLDGLDEVPADLRGACVEAINAFEQAHHPPGLVVSCRVVEYDALSVKLRLRAAICLQPLTPEQIERYFAAAGAGLEPLRQAFRTDAGLRDLARSPLMLSVMTMAWRDAPAVATPDAAEATPEGRRRHLFDAYVQAVLRRRGKATSPYSAEQTVAWLAWLARRMKEHGYSLFAVEQLQPSWLDGTARQFAYFFGTRLVATLGLVAPLLLTKPSMGDLTPLIVVSLTMGSFFGLVDFAIALRGWGGRHSAVLRRWVLLSGCVALLAGWLLGRAAHSDSSGVGAGFAFGVMATLAFCAPLDVRTLDIKPSGTIRWSWRLGLDRMLTALVPLNLVAWIIVGVTAVLDSRSVSPAVLGSGWFLGGLAGGAVLVALGWRHFAVARTVLNIARAVTIVWLTGVLAVVLGVREPPAWLQVLPAPVLMLAILFGLLTGFGSIMIDPTRPQRVGAWFWLRVPVVALLVVGSVTLVPGFMWLAMNWDEMTLAGKVLSAVGGIVSVAAAVGAVAFFRFGGFNGAQHLFLRWQLVRRGHLPPKTEAFLHHAAQLALLQKVGLGYRFVHALLLEHLATAGAGEAPRATAEAPPITPRRGPLALAGRGATVGAVVIGVVSFLAIGLARLGITSVDVPYREADQLLTLLGCLVVALAWGLPVALLGGPWLWRASWPWLAGTTAAVALGFGWLFADDPELRHPVRLPALASASAAGRTSTLHLGSLRARMIELTPRVSLGGAVGGLPSTRWRAHLTKHRTELERNWIALAPMREWLTEQAAAGRFEFVGEGVGTVPWDDLTWRLRRYYLHAQAIAGLQAMAGDGDTAVATLLPLLDLGAKFERAATNLSAFSAGRVLQEAAVNGLGFVLDTTALSEVSRTRVATALTSGIGAAAAARKWATVRHANALRDADSFGQAVESALSQYREKRVWHGAIDVLAAGIYNRRATLNTIGEFFWELEDLAARRETARVEERIRKFRADALQPRFKNLGGAWIFRMVGREFRYSHDSLRILWRIEDQRAALLERLTKR